MIERKFGQWTVLKRMENKDRHKTWLCQCSCGFKRNFTTSYLNCGKATLCINCRKKQKEEINKTLMKKYIGAKYGDFTVKKYLGLNKHGSRQWLCCCKCGFERIFLTSNLYGNGFKKATLCRKCYKQSIELHNRIEYVPNRFWYKLLNVANRRKIEVSITKKYIFNIYKKQNKKCSLTGEKLYFTKLKSNYHRYTTASLDRIDSSKGYIKGNVQWVCKKINMMKQQYSQKEFIEMCKKVAINF